MLKKIVLLLALVLAIPLGVSPSAAIATTPPCTIGGAGQGYAASRDGLSVAIICENNVHISRDAGITWSISQWSSNADTNGQIALSDDGSKMYIAQTYEGSQGGYIFRSSDGGSTWTTLAPQQSRKRWASVAVSSNGEVVALVEHNPFPGNNATQGRVWASSNSGDSWTPTTLQSRDFQIVKMSADGTKIYALASDTTNIYGATTRRVIYKSADSGATWSGLLNTTDTGTADFTGFAIDDEGKRLVVIKDGKIEVSGDFGESWWPNTQPVGTRINGIHMSGDGSTLIAWRDSSLLKADWVNPWVETQVNFGTSRFSYLNHFGSKIRNIYGLTDSLSSEVTPNEPSGSILTSPPRNLSARDVTSNSVALTWLAPTDEGWTPLSGYIFEISSDNHQTWSKIAETNTTSLSKSIGGLASHRDYSLRVSGKNMAGLGSSAYVDFTTTYKPFTPNQPQNLVSTAYTDTTVSLSWEEPTSNESYPISDYLIEMRNSQDSSWSSITRPASTALTYTVTGLRKVNSYNFRVRAVNSIGTGDASSPVTVGTDSSAPGSPGQFTAYSVSRTGISARWSAPWDRGGGSAVITDYLIEISSDDGANWRRIPGLNSFVTTQVDITGLTPGTTYKIRIAAINRVGHGPFLNSEFATSPVAPNAPSGVTAGTKSNTSIQLLWNEHTNNGGSVITDYKVQVSSNCSTYTVVAHSASVNNFITVNKLVAGTKYCFKVTAKNSVGYGPSSATFTSVTLGNTPAAPKLSLKSKSVTKTSVTLIWSKPTVRSGSAIRSYAIQVSTDGGATWVQKVRGALTTRTYLFKGLLSKTSYQFRLMATNDVGDSNPSNVLSATTK